jgi:hypothetical protein
MSLGSSTYGGLRDAWEFEYTASNLAEGAKTQQTFRLSRVAWWRGVYEAVMAEIKASGIIISESSAVGQNYANSKAISPSATIDHTLQAKLTEAHNKIREHEQAAAEYDGWIQVLSANPESRQKLTQADWLYFFGKA